MKLYGRAVMYFAGCVTFALGAYFYIHAELGTDPLDVLALGLMEHLPVTVGIVQTAVAVLCLSLTALLRKRRPPLSPILTFFLCGSMIDLLMYTDPGRYLPLNNMTIMVIGTMLCAYGSALIIMSGFGIRAMDLLAIAVTERRPQVPFWLVKSLLEALMLVSGYLLGGPVGLGTLFFMVLVNGLIQPMMWGNHRLLKLPNFGMADVRQAASRA